MRLPTVVLFLCCALLATIVYGEASYHPDTVTLVSLTAGRDGSSQPDLPEPNNVHDFPPLSHFREITDRPLFAPSRRPTPANARYQLRGVLLSGERKIALLEGRTANALMRVHEGDFIGNWRVLSIDADAIKLLGADGLQTMTIALAHPASEPETRDEGRSEDNEYEENEVEEDVYARWGLNHRSRHSDNRGLGPEPPDYTADRSAMNNASAVPTELPPPLPPPPAPPVEAPR